ncbi:hypothetical protein SADUNF_Sadunf11G0117600 [Salix dunnii]|uniref:Uncharacterized protein n=1 Tax=Salix dunnii TaxID=1413687 RepID=A0A835JLE4_9ROSI|nr:hypothetical protein SADUNF_Sadunf11G0117600 [Salix dunnii]
MAIICADEKVRPINEVQFLSKIPGACNIKVGFPVSTSVSCDAIHWISYSGSKLSSGRGVYRRVEIYY